MKAADGASFLAGHAPAESIEDIERSVTRSSENVVVDIHDARHLPAGLGTEWDGLVAAASEPNPFAERFYVEAGLRAFADEGAVRLITVHNKGRLCGLLPFAIGHAYGRQRVQHVVNWQHSNSFLGTPLVRKREEATFWLALLQCLDQAKWARSFVHLEGMVEDGPVHRGLKQVVALTNRPCDIVHRENRPMMASKRNAEDYLAANLSSKRRGEYRRKRRRLAEIGKLETRILTPDCDFSAWLDDFLALEAAGWKGEAGSAIESCPKKAVFFREVLQVAHAQQLLHAMRLDLDGRAIAMQTSLLRSPGAFGFKSCFDEDYARFSPGLLLQIDNLGLLERPDIEWQDSCAREGHAVGALWSEQRSIIRITLGLSGLRRRAKLAAVRAVEESGAALKAHLLADGEAKR